jgi:hypothetical protein
MCGSLESACVDDPPIEKQYLALLRTLHEMTLLFLCSRQSNFFFPCVVVREEIRRQGHRQRWKRRGDVRSSRFRYYGVNRVLHREYMLLVALVLYVIQYAICPTKQHARAFSYGLATLPTCCIPITAVCSIRIRRWSRCAREATAHRPTQHPST